ncbi:MAG TPA: sulfite dehydrogenase [Gemmatimonadales bacterium]|nr:sulfite dehydrogenase [Gemmatimonadales bacterium]
MSDDSRRISRRTAITTTAGAVGAALLARAGLAAQDTPAAAPSAPPDATKLPGLPTSAVSGRSPFVHPERTPTGVLSGPSFTPLQDLTGTITPSDLHFERHHGGAAVIDPQKWKLVIHGMVERPLTFDLEDLKRFPSVTRVHFIECAGNGRNAYRTPKPDMTPQQVDGLTSNTEWTGVPLSLLLREAGVKSKATWFLAEGGDAAVLSRSIPIAKGLDDALLVWGQNGEPLRVQNGYPVRLLLPGWEGNACVKWLRRLELIDQPNMSRDETSKYTDPLPGGKARQFSFEMDAKSIITSPVAPARLSKAGWWPVRGLAWSGRGRITRVEVSTDGGKSWADAELQGPVTPKAHARFQHMWNWDGKPALLLSRATDETGYVQPTRAAFQAARGIGTDFHFNYIRGWRVDRDGAVMFEGEA